MAALSVASLEKQIIRFGEQHKNEQLQRLLTSVTVQQVIEILKLKLYQSDFQTLWHYILMGFNTSGYDAKEKRFACVKYVLDSLQTRELSYKHTYDLITRLCQDLSTFSKNQLIEILEYCVDCIQSGDPKSTSWKDLLPEILNILSQMIELNVNGFVMSGLEYRNSIIRKLCMIRWSTDVSTPLAAMFRDLKLTSLEIVTVLNKFSGILQSMTPTALPALAYQLFTLSDTASQIIIPILALERYFHRFYYKQLFADMNSNSTNYDSIDQFSDTELREAEETILHHLSYCTQYKINEMQMSIVLKNFTALPDVILTPFVLSAILSMSQANRQPNNYLKSSILLLFLRKVIKHNEDERLLAEYSVWCRDSLQRKQVDLQKIFTVLIDRNKDGKDIVTPGLVNLAFFLLKSKQNSQLNALAIDFLTKFIRKRFIFGQGIVKKVAEMMMVAQDDNQYSECLTALSVADTFTVSECITTIKNVMEKFLWIPGDQSLHMMSFILPILKISPIIRDAFIDVLRKAIVLSDLNVCRMAVYGFCMILKQLNNSNSQRSHSQINVGGMCTQQSIASFSLMSQATLNTRPNTQRNFDMLTLDIIGTLRVCFQYPVAVKITLYENLIRAVELNPKLVPHVLQFIDYHFRNYFDNKSTIVRVKFEKIAYAINDQESVVHVQDNLGYLLLFLSHCLAIFEKCESDYNVKEIKRLIDTSLEKITNNEMKFEEMTGSLTLLKSELILQQMNFLEGLMSYCILISQNTNDYIKYITNLYKQHKKLMEILKAAVNKKSHKKPFKGYNDSTEASAPTNLTINGVHIKKINPEFVNIWDLVVLERLLRLLHEDIVPFINTNTSTTIVTMLRSNIAFVRYVLEVAATKIKQIRHEANYKQISHSKRTFKHLTDLTRIIYERCMKRLPEVWQKFDLKVASLATEVFLQCLQTANITYKKRFAQNFIKGFDLSSLDKSKDCIVILQDVIDKFMEEEYDTSGGSIGGESLLSEMDGRKIPLNLFLCLEILYDYASFDNRLTIDSYTWLLKFCQTYPLEVKELSLVHKLLFKQRQKTHSGAFFQIIPKQLANLWLYIRDELTQDEDEQLACIQKHVGFKSFTESTAESSLHFLYETLNKQIQDIDYFITKANNLSYKYCWVAQEDRDYHTASLRSMERSICSQLIHVSQTIKYLTNVCIPLGACMDGLMKLLILHYVCLKNLTKHFIHSCNIGLKVSLRGAKFDLLLREVGKPLPSNIYALITYIECNILDESDNNKKVKTKPNAQMDKAKVLRETKYIPKVILCIENFNKHVIMLSKKTNEGLANFLHFGTVRDFRLKTTDLKAAIERTLSHSSQIKDVEADLETPDNIGYNTTDDEEESILQQMIAEAEQLSNDERVSRIEKIVDNAEASTSRNSKSKNYQKKATDKQKVKAKNHEKVKEKIQIETFIDSTTDSADGITPEILENETDSINGSQLMRNVAKINATVAKKRTLKDSEQQDTDVTSGISTEPQQKKFRRGRSRM